MKRYIFGFIALCLCLLPIASEADWYVNPYRHAADTSVRPTLVGVNAAGISTTNATSRTVSVTPPVGTTLLLAYIAFNTDEDTVQTATTPTLGGTPLTTLNSTAEFSGRLTSYFAYQINPTTGAAQNLVFGVSGVTWQASYLYVWFFSGVNTSDPFANNRAGNSTSAQGLTTTFAPSYPRPYIVAGASGRSSSGAGNCWTSPSGLTIANQGNDSGNNDTMVAAANSSLVFSGSTTFSLSCSYASSFRSFDIVEVKGQ